MGAIASGGTAAGRRGIRRLVFGARHGAPPLLAIPGIDGSPGSILPLVEGLAASRQVHVLDYRDEVHDTLESLADSLAAASAELPGQAHLLGQSIGAALAALVASQRAEAIERVVLVGPFTRGRWGTLRMAARLARLSPASLYRATTRPLMALACGPVGDGHDHPFFWHAARSDQAGSARRTGWQVGRDFSAAFAALDQPVLALLGDRDRFVPDATLEIGRLRRLLSRPGQAVEPIPGAGHVVLPSAAVAWCTDAIDGFLA